jgi:predicted GTPase
MFRNAIKYLEPFLEGNQPKLLDIDSEHSLNDVKIQFSQTKNQYMSELQRFSMLIIDGRSNQATPSKIYHARHDPEQMALKESMHKLAQSLKGLNIKIFSSTSLRQKILECLNAVEHCLNENNDARTIERKPIKHNPCNQNLESQDNSKSEDRFNSNIQRQRSNRGHANNSPRSPPAVSSLDSPIRKGNTATSPSDAINHSTDHSKRRPSSPERSLSTSLASPSSSSSIKATSPSDEIKYSKDYSKQRASSSESSSPTSPTSPLSSSSTDDIINILLLGETGVGKSTFINAFANYLAFNSLEQAQTNEPIVLIPVSFIMTTGDNFEEQTIKFGEYDSSNNENFNNVGQSVTQHCKSYTFALHQYDGKKLRIIDTPGFGDTRGLEQDDQNMEHILQYISRLTHLNAICFLLKPNSSRLNMFFRTCLTQLFSFLAPTARKNVIFCFTNARSTFYTPGDTSPLLKAMLADSSMSDIPFKKDNTFCFDSESFRYLVALRNKITFSDDDEREYRTSWSTSVKESTRAIDYINENLTVHPIENELQSIKQVQFEISHMIRPILEAMRNILRNMILCENKLSNQFIKLNPTALHRTDVLYHSCRSNPEQVGKFWIIPNVSVETQDDSLECSCTLDQSVQMDYVLKHECLDGVVDRHQHATEKTLQMLCNASTELAHFLMHVAYSTKHDPFLIGLKTMIDEETYICRTQEQAQFNKKLIEKLRLLENDYIQKRNEMKPNQKYMGLPAMCKFVKTISEWPLVREQLIAVKKTQQSMMEQYEYETQKI